TSENVRALAPEVSFLRPRPDFLGNMLSRTCDPPAAKRQHRKARHVSAGERGSETNRVPLETAPEQRPHMIERFHFSDLRELFAKANEEKSGDQLAGIAARSERERVAAKRKLADLTLDEIVRRPLIDPDHDDVTRLILDSFDQQAFRAIKSMTVGEFREFLLDDGTTETQLQPLQP